jgi:ParB-like chromosome segregation protein Spo0J
MPIVTYYDATIDRYIVVDGFHRYILLTKHFGCPEVPVVVIDKNIQDRMASTVRHNRARGKHQVDLMAELVKVMIQKGCSDEEIAEHLGMSDDELVRLKQVVGIAKLFAIPEYTRAWGESDEI